MSAHASRGGEEEGERERARACPCRAPSTTAYLTLPPSITRFERYIFLFLASGVIYGLSQDFAMSSCDFRASMWYQRVAPWHVCSAGLEYKLDFGSDDNFARLCTRGPAIVEPACVRARVCSADDERSDAAAVASRIRSAAEANKADEVEYAIRTCFASARICAPSLESAAKNGFADVARVLLDAGVPGDVLLPSARGKRPLHIACEQGHEAVARLIIEALPSAVDDRDDRGFTPLEIARRSDMGGMARRLDALCASLAAKSRVGEAGDGALPTARVASLTEHIPCVSCREGRAQAHHTPQGVYACTVHRMYPRPSR